MLIKIMLNMESCENILFKSQLTTLIVVKKIMKFFCIPHIVTLQGIESLVYFRFKAWVIFTGLEYIEW